MLSSEIVSASWESCLRTAYSPLLLSQILSPLHDVPIQRRPALSSARAVIAGETRSRGWSASPVKRTNAPLSGRNRCNPPPDVPTQISPCRSWKIVQTALLPRLSGPVRRRPKVDRFFRRRIPPEEAAFFGPDPEKAVPVHEQVPDGAGVRIQLDPGERPGASIEAEEAVDSRPDPEISLPVFLDGEDDPASGSRPALAIIGEPLKSLSFPVELEQPLTGRSDPDVSRAVLVRPGRRPRAETPFPDRREARRNRNGTRRNGPGRSWSRTRGSLPGLAECSTRPARARRGIRESAVRT